MALYHKSCVKLDRNGVQVSDYKECASCMVILAKIGYQEDVIELVKTFGVDKEVVYQEVHRAAGHK